MGSYCILVNLRSTYAPNVRATSCISSVLYSGSPNFDSVRREKPFCHTFCVSSKWITGRAMVISPPLAFRPFLILDDWLTVQRSITLVDLQLDAQKSYLFTYNTFIKILYMFRVLPCSSSGGLRRNCICAASGIVTVCRWLSFAPPLLS